MATAARMAGGAATAWHATCSQSRVESLTVSRDLADTFPYGVTLWRAESDQPSDLRLMYANPQASRELGFDLSTFVGSTLSKLLPGGDPPTDGLTTKGLEAALRQQLHVLPRYRPSSVAGGQREFQVHLVPVWERTVAVVYKTLDDDEDHASRERARVYFEDVVHTLHEPLAVVSESLELLWANPVFLDTFGLTPGVFEGGKLSQAGGDGCCDHRLGALVAEGFVDRLGVDVEEVELTLETGTGEPRTFLVHARLLEGPRSEPRLMLVALRDVTSARRLEEAQRQFVKRMVEARDADRRAVALELHDHVGQTITSMAVSVERLLADGGGSAEATAVRDGLLGLREGLKELSQDVSRMARGLHPFVLDELGFEAAVRQLLAELGELHGIEVGFALTGFGTQPELAPATALALYRMLQEALNNVARHARCKQVNVTAHREPRHVRLVVEDDGIGFDPEASRRPGCRPSLGLVSLRERAEALGGVIEIESSERGGTTLVVTLPLPAGVAGVAEPGASDGSDAATTGARRPK